MILTIGDSFTYGEELSDRLAHAWPYLVANALQLPVKNLGLGGGSNDYIFRTVIEETTQTKYDIVIVQWSEPSRMEVWHKDKPINVTAHSNWKSLNELDWMKSYYANSYNDLFRYRTWFCHVVALQGYFKSINQKYLFVNLAGLRGYYNEYHTDLQHLWNKLDKQHYVGWPLDGFLEFQGDCPKGAGGHPLELGHERIAGKINEHIRTLGWV